MVLPLLFKEQIDESDLIEMIGLAIEDEMNEFKRAAYPKADADSILEFCKDVTALANLQGGTIVCGMDDADKDGIADDLCGLGIDTNGDRETQRLQQIADKHIEPQIHGLRIRHIPLADPTKKCAIVIQVPRSFAAPHRIKQSQKFKIRHGTTNVDMTMDELRMAFNRADGYVARIRTFRNERVETLALLQDYVAVPIRLAGGVRLIVHVVPFAFNEPGNTVDLIAPFQKSRASQWVVREGLRPVLFNFHGVVVDMKKSSETKYSQYIQIFRHGAVEFVSILATDKRDDSRILKIEKLEESALYGLNKAFSILENLNVSLPVAVLLSVANVRDVLFLTARDDQIRKRMLYPPEYAADLTPVKSSELLLPETVFYSLVEDVRIRVKQTFDILWNIGGFVRSPSYNDSDEWINEDYS